MFKVLSASLAVALFCVAAAPQAASDPGRAESPLETVAQSTSTPEQLARFLNARLIFQEDLALFGQTDYWQTPEEVLVRGRGDCEDYALLANDLLKRQGKKSFVFSLYGPRGYAHTVCVFVEGGRFNLMNQDRLIRTQAASLEELADELCRDWEWGAVAEQNGHRGRAVQIVRRETATRRPSPSSS
ncbi:MAG: transglutaminase-like cysteine peptidase [Candidatus Omnitrophota bacterium]|nr:transglutaminase-like cysteine peptidase [Candidatus Omnitrophota bacterium]